MSQATPGVLELSGPKLIKPRTGDQPVPREPGELIIDQSPEETIDLAFRGGTNATLPQVADRAITLVAQVDPEFAPLALLDAEGRPVRAHDVAATVFADSLARLNGMDGHPLNEPVPAHQTIYAVDLKSLLQPIVAVYEEKGVAGLMGMLQAPAGSPAQRRTLGDAAAGAMGLPMTGEPPPRTA
jgi:hypothetical protein